MLLVITSACSPRKHSKAEAVGHTESTRSNIHDFPFPSLPKGRESHEYHTQLCIGLALLLFCLRSLETSLRNSHSKSGRETDLYATSLVSNRDHRM